MRGNDPKFKPALRCHLLLRQCDCDYERFKADLEHINKCLSNSGMKELVADLAIEGREADSLSSQRRQVVFGDFALRAELLRNLLGLPSFRAFSRMLASSDLLADFCEVRTLMGIKGTSKSTLERASKFFTKKQMDRLLKLLVEVAGNGDLCAALSLEEPIEASVCLADSTCLEANIHHPVDWVLLRDSARTLLKAVELVRQAGLRVRMPEAPEAFLRQMNRLCIKMTHSRRRKDGKRLRKSVLRDMKALLKQITGHAQRHRDLLAKEQARSSLGPGQAAQIMARLDRHLEQVPHIIKQAHERIIGGRQVPSAEKILSLYESDLHTIVRSKAGKEVEFGNGLLLCESPDGFILDFELYKERPPGDGQMLKDSLKRQQELDLEAPVEAVVGDRGFSSKAVAKALEAQGIEDLTCPRNAQELGKRMQDKDFSKWQRRRGQTEGRIAILKNNGGGRVCRAKGFEHRELAVSWGVLAHNLWWVARKVRDQEEGQSGGDPPRQRLRAA